MDARLTLSNLLWQQGQSGVHQTMGAVIRQANGYRRMADIRSTIHRVSSLMLPNRLDASAKQRTKRTPSSMSLTSEGDNRSATTGQATVRISVRDCRERAALNLTGKPE